MRIEYRCRLTSYPPLNGRTVKNNSQVPTRNAHATMKDWVHMYSDDLYTWAFYKTSHRETAEDLVQETFLAALQSLETFQNKSDPKTWLISILSNKIADHFRKSYRSILKSAPVDTFFDGNGTWTKEYRPQDWHVDDEQHLLDRPEFGQALAGCLDKLPESWRLSVVKKFLEQKSSQAICQELEITPTNYWQILHRAKMQLRKCLEVHWFRK